MKFLGNTMYVVYSYDEIVQAVYHRLRSNPVRRDFSHKEIMRRIHERGVAITAPLSQYPLIISIDLRNTIMVDCAPFPSTLTECQDILNGTNQQIESTTYKLKLETNEVVYHDRLADGTFRHTHAFVYTTFRTIACETLAIQDDPKMSNDEIQLELHKTGRSGSVIISPCPVNRRTCIHDQILRAVGKEKFDEELHKHKTPESLFRKLYLCAVAEASGTTYILEPRSAKTLQQINLKEFR